MQTQAYFRSGRMEHEKGESSVYDAVVSLLQDLYIMFCCHDHDLGSGSSFSSCFRKEDIQIMYDKLSSIKSLLADPSVGSYRKKMTRSLKIRIADTVKEAQDYIVSMVQSLIGPNLDRRATGIAAQSSTVLGMLFRIPDQEEHFLVYDEVVSLLHDLELSLSSHRHTFESEQYLFSASMEGDLQILYDNLSKMDSLLLDSSGQSYDNKLINSLENWICFVVYRGLHYIYSWPRSSIPGPNVETHPTADVLTAGFMMRIESINEELKMFVMIERSLRKCLPGSISRGLLSTAYAAGLFPTALNWFCRTPREWSNLLGPGKHLLTILDHPEPNIEYQTSSSLLRQIIRCIESVNHQFRKIHDDRDVLENSTQSLESTTYAGQDFTIPNSLRGTSNVCKIVGLEQDLLIMLDLLEGYSPQLQVFPVIGMGGIGKTTFTKSLYDNPRLKHHFDIRAWFTISQHYQLTEVLIRLLRCITNSNTEIHERNDEELKYKLYRSLKDRRYLFVLDDVWDKKVWDDLKKIFPDDENGSRIILTSRLKDVATHASPNPPHSLRCLNVDESWELLC